MLDEEIIFKYSLHKRLWNYLSFHPEMDKVEAIDSMLSKSLLTNNDHYFLQNATNNCTSCDYAISISKLELDKDPNYNYCSNCPFEFRDKSKCLGGAYDDWLILHNNYLNLKEANSRYTDGKDFSDLIVIDKNNKLSIDEYVKKYIRKGYTWETTLSDRVLKASVNCMIAASTICCLDLKPRIKIDN